MSARKQFLLRIDPELWQALEKWAADELRSVNAQVEWLLREAVRQRKGAPASQDPPSSAADEDHAAAGDRSTASVLGQVDR